MTGGLSDPGAGAADARSRPALADGEDKLAGPARAAQVRSQWRTAAGALNETEAGTAGPLPPAQADRVTGALQALRNLAGEPGRLAR